MSSIVTERGIVHYETFGRGQPVVLLHCWLGSWNYWMSTRSSWPAQDLCPGFLGFWRVG